MAKLIAGPTVVECAGNLPKKIEEYVGRVNSETSSVSIAHEQPAGMDRAWPDPEFDEYTLVLKGTLRVETKTETIDVHAGQAVHARKRRVDSLQYPEAGGAEYVAVCLPAFSVNTVHRDE